MPDFLELRRNLAETDLNTDEGCYHVTYRPGVFRSPKAMRLSNMGQRLEDAGKATDSDEALALMDELVAFLPRGVVSWDVPEYPGGPLLDPHGEALYFQGYDTLVPLFTALMVEAASGPKSTPAPPARPLPGSGGARRNRPR